jgi:uncharacterized OB-fold protein
MRPRPEITPLTQPFWDGARAGRLVLQRCRACGHYDHPPFPECTQCRSAETGFVPVSGRGTIFQRCIVASPVVAGFEQRIPYACLAVELDEQPGLVVIGNLVEAPPQEAVIGRRVEVVFEDAGEGFVLPMFRLASRERS